MLCLSQWYRKWTSQYGSCLSQNVTVNKFRPGYITYRFITLSMLCQKWFSASLHWTEPHLVQFSRRQCATSNLWLTDNSPTEQLADGATRRFFEGFFENCRIWNCCAPNLTRLTLLTPQFSAFRSPINWSVVLSVWMCLKRTKFDQIFRFCYVPLPKKYC